MERNRKIIIFMYVLTDFILLMFSLKVAYMVRFGYPVPVGEYILFKKSFLLFAGIQIVMLYLTGVYSIGWKYTVKENIKKIVYSFLLSFLIITTIIFFRRDLSFSRSVLAIDNLIGILFLLSLRFGLKINTIFKSGIIKDKDRCIIIGAGEAGQRIVQQCRDDNKFSLYPVAFLDDNENKIGKKYFGVPVVDKISMVKTVSKTLGVNNVVISIPSAEGSRIRKIIRYCQNANIGFRIVPGIKQIIDGDVSLQDIRYFEPEDLLGRETVKAYENDIMETINNKKIVITGAAGSIGFELLNQVLKYSPEKVVAIDQNETGIFNISKIGDKRIKTYLADIYNKERIDWIFEKEKPDIVFHAAAYKHVPVLEENIYEAVKTNVIGTINIIKAVINNSVKKLVIISTDKAVDCEGIMGMTKRLGELLVSKASEINPNLIFSAVRFGNVLGSSGSVVPIFVEQIKKGGPITITHPDMIRYFMTIKEAVSLVLQSAVFNETASLYVLNMGDPIKIMDLAKNLITIYGKKVNEDIEIKITGLRPGEKMEEKLFYDYEEIEQTVHPEIRKVKNNNITGKIPNIDSIYDIFYNIHNEKLMKDKLQKFVS